MRLNQRSKALEDPQTMFQLCSTTNIITFNQLYQ